MYYRILKIVGLLSLLLLLATVFLGCAPKLEREIEIGWGEDTVAVVIENGGQPQPYSELPQRKILLSEATEEEKSAIEALRGAWSYTETFDSTGYQGWGLGKTVIVRFLNGDGAEISEYRFNPVPGGTVILMMDGRKPGTIFNFYEKKVGDCSYETIRPLLADIV